MYFGCPECGLLVVRGSDWCSSNVHALATLVRARETQLREGAKKLVIVAIDCWQTQFDTQHAGLFIQVVRGGSRGFELLTDSRAVAVAVIGLAWDRPLARQGDSSSPYRLAWTRCRDYQGSRLSL